MSTIKKIDQIIRDLREIKERGYQQTIRAGDTGVGTTLESLLGIEENNIAGPNGHQTELKSKRKTASSMLTLFTKSPLPRAINRRLVDHYGYPSDKKPNEKILHTTVYFGKFTYLLEKPGFKIATENDKIQLVHKHPSKNIPEPYWPKDALKKSFLKKYQRWLLWVIADARGSGKNEEFWFNKAYLLSGFSFKHFLKLIQDGTIAIDIRLGRYPNGKLHDHGTGFRVAHDKLDQCFATRERVL